MTDTITPQALLKRAVDIITERGWHQGDFVGNDGCVCMLGAVRVAAIDAAGVEVSIRELDTTEMDELVPEDFADAVEKAEAKLQELVEDAWLINDPARWNDDEGRTAAEVQEMLRRAAEEVE